MTGRTLEGFEHLFTKREIERGAEYVQEVAERGYLQLRIYLEEHEVSIIAGVLMANGLPLLAHRMMCSGQDLRWRIEAKKSEKT